MLPAQCDTGATSERKIQQLGATAEPVIGEAVGIGAGPVCVRATLADTDADANRYLGRVCALSLLAFGFADLLPLHPFRGRRTGCDAPT